MHTQNIKSYIELIDTFLDNKISASTFEREYLNMFKNDPTTWSEEEYTVLNDLFGDVDAFCADPSLRDKDDLDENQLRQQSEKAVIKLKALNSSQSKN